MGRKLTTIQRQVLEEARDHGVVYSGIANLGHQQWHKSTLISLEKKHMLCLKDEWWKTSAHPAYEITTIGRKALEGDATELSKKQARMYALRVAVDLVSLELAIPTALTLPDYDNDLRDEDYDPIKEALTQVRDNLQSQLDRLNRTKTKSYKDT